MKNFTATMLSLYEGVVSNSGQCKTVKKSELGSIHNYRANLLSNIPTRNFLGGFYGIFSGLLKRVKGRVSSIDTGFNSLGKYHNYLDVFTGSNVYLDGGKASIIGRSLTIILVSLLTINVQTAQAQCTGIAGTVFRDFNLNGKKDVYDIGLAGVTVKAFNSANAQIGETAITAANGTYTITGATGQVRVEFSVLPTGYVSGPDGLNSSTSVQFVTANACNVDYGVNQSEDFCAKEGVQPKVAVPCYANGKYDATGTNGAGLEDALVSFAYNKTGDKATSGNAPYLMSSYNKIGAVWGMAYNKYNKTLFTTAFMKRHSGFGPKGIAGLYVVQNADNNGSGYVITGIDLETIAGLSTGFAGVEPTRNLVTDKTQPLDDGGNAVFNAVGKMSFGDCELSEDGNTLYITNLFDKKIYAFNVSDPLAPTLIGSFLVPSPDCTVSSEYEPFGLKYHRGKLYVGVICTAQSSQPASNGLSSANLKATVYELNSGTFTTVLPSFSLNYDRGLSNSSANSYAIWRPWVSSWSQVPTNIAETYPQPMLSDIEFDTDGSMILGFADRFSHQLGNANYPPGETFTQTGRVEGDVMRATKSGSTWTIENNGTASGRTTSGAGKGSGPGGGEYYFGDITVDHDEPAMGGLLLFPGTGEVMTTTAGPANIFYSGGTRRMNNQTGDYLYTGAPIAWNSVSDYRLNYDSRPAPTGDYKLYEGNNPGTFGKASGLGDMEIFCSLAPLEIGNRIWRDFDQDGIQDANEPGINAITVLLFKGGIQVASTATNTAGEYYFNDANVTGGLLPNMAYQIRVLTNQVSNTFLSPKDAESNDSADSDGDGTIISGYAVINLMTGIYGESNHTYDVGFSPNCPTLSNPQPNSGNVVICSGSAIPLLSLTASNVNSQSLPTTTSVKWCAFNSVQADPYTLTGVTCLTTASITTLADGTITANNLAGLSSTPGKYYVYALLNPTPEANNPNCRPYVSYIVTVSEIPSPPSSIMGGSACTVGGSAVVSMSAVCASGSTPTWYSSMDSTVALSTGAEYSPSISATTTYYVGCKNTTANCESTGASRSAVVATVVNTPSAPVITVIGGNSSSCGSPITLESGCSTGILKWSNNATTAQIIVSTSGTYTATCTLTGTIICTSPASNSITVTINTVPSAPTEANIQNGTICQPGVVNLVATCGNNEVAQWYDGNVANSTFLFSGGTYSPSISATTTYFVGCKNTAASCETAAGARASVVGTINSNLAAPISVTSNDSCQYIGNTPDEPTKILLKATCGSNQTPEWFTATGSALGVLSNTYIASVTATTTFTVGCKDDSTGCQTLPANRKPVVATVITNVSNGGEIQANQSNCGEFIPSKLTNKTFPLGSNTTIEYLWLLNPTGAIIDYDSSDPNWIVAGGGANNQADYQPGTIKKTTSFIRCSRSAGCNDYTGESNIVVITIYPVPAAPTNVPENGSVCLGETYTISGVCASNEKIKWYDNQSSAITIESSSSFTKTYTPTVIGTYSYTISCINSTNCETVATNRKIITLVVNSSQTALASSNSPVCLGSPINLTSSGSGTNFLWTGSGFTSTVQNPSVSPLPTTAGIYTYAVLVSGTGGCTGTATTSVTVKATPTVTVPSIAICAGATGTLVATGADSYSWSNTDGAFTSTSASLIITKTGVYTVIGTTAGCTAVATVNVGAKTTPTVTVPPITICGTTGTLMAAGASSYVWSNTDGTFTTTTASLSVTKAGTYTVVGTNEEGCTASATTSVTINTNPNPVITPITSKCIGEPIVLNVSGGTGNTYSWTGSGFTSTVQNPSVNPLPTTAGIYTYAVLVSGTGGCTGTSTTSVTVKATPTVNVLPISICKGAIGTLTSTSADSYSWSSSNTGFTGTTQSVSVSQAGTYSVMITTNGCTAIATTTVTEKATPTVIATGTTICNGVSGNLTASGANTYSWTGPGTFTATGANPVVTVEGLYTVTGTNVDGCVGTATASLTIKANPTVSITGNTTTCTIGSTTLTANSNGTYLWSGPNGFSATSKEVSVDKTGLYTVIVSNNGCQATGTVNVVADEVEVKAIGQVVCEGVKKTGLNSIINNKSGIQSYAWIGSDGFTSTQQSPLIIKPTASATYTLTVITKAGCTATATAAITVTPAPTSTATITFCKGGKATLTANGGFNATYLWTGGFTTSSIQVSTAGTYDVTVTDTSGCISKGKFFVTESAAASAVITGNTSLCASGSTKLTVNEGAIGEIYSWTGIGGFTSTSQMITVSKPGDYAVLVKTVEGCEGTAKVTVTAGFTPTAVCGPVCEGDSIKFTATQLKGLTYSWSKNGTFISSSADPKLLNVQKSDAGVYEVVITGFGCTATVVATLVVYDRPSGLTATVINSTCDGNVSKNDGQVKLVGTFTGLKYDVVEGATYSGAKKYADATNIPSDGIVKSSIANPATAAGTKYTVRVFNANNCFTDYTVIIQQATCDCGVAKCVPYGVTKTKSGKK